MKVERANAAVIAAKETRPTRLGDQQKSGSATPLDHSLLPAFLAPVIAAPFKDELRLAVRSARSRGELRKLRG